MPPAITEAQPSALKPSEVLAKAADLIEPEGAWIQGAMRDFRYGRNCYCAVGALAAVVGGDDVWRDKYGDVIRPLFARVVPHGLYPMEFNDRDETTQAEVVKALRDAAELAKAEGQ